MAFFKLNVIFWIIYNFVFISSTPCAYEHFRFNRSFFVISNERCFCMRQPDICPGVPANRIFPGVPLQQNVEKHWVHSIFQLILPENYILDCLFRKTELTVIFEADPWKEQFLTLSFRLESWWFETAKGSIWHLYFVDSTTYNSTNSLNSSNKASIEIFFNHGFFRERLVCLRSNFFEDLLTDITQCDCASCFA